MEKQEIFLGRKYLNPYWTEWWRQELDSAVVMLRRFLFASMCPIHSPTAENVDRHEFRYNDALNVYFLLFKVWTYTSELAKLNCLKYEQCKVIDEKPGLQQHRTVVWPSGRQRTP